MSDIQIIPAPWQLKGRSWTALVAPLSKTTSFPAGWCSGYQADTLSSGGEFIGGLGVIQIVSYSESPIGPYDELVYVPGRWKYSDGTKAFRITQIYVSSKESAMNGRKNWNIPKSVASFNIKTGPNGETNIAVSHPGASSPFFKASFTPISLLSSLSIYASTSIAGNFFSLVQPPLPAGEQPEEVATDQWVAFRPPVKGSASVRGMVAGLDGKVGDGVSFPAVAPWSIGFTMKNLSMEFVVPTMHDVI
ncbi:hypothetical protein DFH06DRAFT_1334488 [Mycena polygramma]|nr:hypothetical protein DFH06DRAFT_1334488 [Mycena polygramma]